MRMSRSRMKRMAKWTWLATLALASSLLLAGCGTVTTHASQAPAGATDPTFAKAAELARQDATLSGQARQDNAAQIDRLLAAIDNATLARQAAALPVGD